jgi:phage terminase large subunit GpA-like protein
MALCPHCNSMVSYLNLEAMTSSVFMGTKWNTIAYVCPHCNKIINAQIDPIAIKTDTVNEIKKNLI